MPYITLTTDLGTQDWYTGALKGALLSAAPTAQLVDVSHSIRAFDIVQAALVVRNVWTEFPSDTIHALAVNCVYSPDARFVALRHEGHFFLAPDNGLLTLLFEGIPAADLRLLSVPPDAAHFSVKKTYADAVAHIAAGRDFEALGSPLDAPLLRRISIQPVITAAQIRGTVIHIDHFDNVVLNIRRDTFEEVRKNRAFSLFFKRNDPLQVLSRNYSDVPLGEPLCLFNSADLLEIAVNFGRAATLLGLKVEDVVEVNFEGGALSD
jgi:S-adenosyl-L-methionine hydrolase (adenosine-forming)